MKNSISAIAYSGLKKSLLVIFLASCQIVISQTYTYSNSFNETGQFFFGNPDGKELFTGMALQPDGKIIFSGTTDYDPDEGGNKRGLVVRLKTNGTLDSLFGNNGVVYIDSPGNSDEITALELQPDGKILLAGHTELNNNGVYVYSTIIRLEANGALDGSFGVNGICLIESTIPNLLWDIEIDTDGKIVGSGFAIPPNSGRRPFVTRLNINGTLDVSFANIGYKILNEYGNFDTAGDGVAIQEDHKIVFINSLLAGISTRITVIIRLNSDGSPDTGFGPNGNGFLDARGESYLSLDYPKQIAIDNLENIVYSGFSSDNSFSGTSHRFFVRRIKPNGNFDLSFDGDGKTSFDPYPGVGNPDEAYAMKVLPDGSILLGGRVATNQVAIVKFLQNGAQDLGFDGDGIWQSAIGTFGVIGEILYESDCIYLGGSTQLSPQPSNDDDAFSAKICTNTVSTSNNLRYDNIIMFPNPTTGIISLTQRVDKILVHDLLGNQITSELFSQTIDLSQFNNGIYLISLIVRGEVFRKQKIILMK